MNSEVEQIIGWNTWASCEPVPYTVDDLLAWLMPVCGLIYVSRDVDRGVEVSVIFSDKLGDGQFGAPTLLEALEQAVQAAFV